VPEYKNVPEVLMWVICVLENSDTLGAWSETLLSCSFGYTNPFENSPLTFSRFLQIRECRQQWLFTWLYHNRADVLENQTLLLGTPQAAFWCGISENSWCSLLCWSVKSFCWSALSLLLRCNPTGVLRPSLLTRKTPLTG